MLHLAFFVLLYFLPAMIFRDQHGATGIFLLNAFLGWTVSGWVFALIWACTAQPSLRAYLIPVAAGVYFGCRCGPATCPGAHDCTAYGYAV
jgi:hypothetical protein